MLLSRDDKLKAMRCISNTICRAFRALMLVLTVSLIPAFCYAADVVDLYLQPLINPIPKQIRFNLTIENPTSETLHDQVIWLYTPVKRTATQQLQTLDINIPYTLEEDALGNQIVKIQIHRLPPYATKLVDIKANLLMSSTPNLSQLKKIDIFTADEKFIEKSDPLIQSTIATIKGGQVAETALRIYEWVKSNIHYSGYIADDLGAKHAVVNKNGDCTEYAYLATALARADGVSARVLGGYVIDRNSAPKAEEYHNWAEVYVDGAWRLLDAQKENYQVNQDQYVAMRIISQHVPNSLGASHRFRVQGSANVRMN